MQPSRARRVLVIALDAAHAPLVERWMDEGELPVLARLRRGGSWTSLEGYDMLRDAVPWTAFSTGLPPEASGHWQGYEFSPATYDVVRTERFDFRTHPPFWAHVPGLRVVTLDLPQAGTHPAFGTHVLGWDGHPHEAPSSAPPDLLVRILARHGPHPVGAAQWVETFDGPACARFAEALVRGAALRARVVTDLLESTTWDLFLAGFSEVHLAGHYLWHLHERSHPLANGSANGRDPVLEVHRAVDRAIGEIEAAAPPDAALLVVSVHGMRANVDDLASNVFLPELLLRAQLPGRVGVGPGPGRARPSTRVAAAPYWADRVWAVEPGSAGIHRILARRLLPGARRRRRFDLAWRRRVLRGPARLWRRKYAFHWLPSMWYSTLWPRLEAFALPSFSDGLVRLNVEGRESRGLVPPAEFARALGLAEERVRGLRDGRTGRPLVADVRRMRDDAFDERNGAPAADLVVSWRPDVLTDLAAHAAWGRIGPVPFWRTGTHAAGGFLLARGARASHERGHVLAMAPTILGLLGHEAPRGLCTASLLAPEAATAQV